MAEQEERHLFYCCCALHPKPFDVGRSGQRVRVMVEHCELFH